MKRIFSGKYALILISILGIGTGIALACAGDWGNEYGTSNFTPEVFVDSAYSPFFYSMQYYYGIGHDEAMDTRFNKQNVADWTGWLGSRYTPAELTWLLQNATSGSLDSAMAKAQAKGEKRSIDFLKYLGCAKAAEVYTIDGPEYDWYNTSSRRHASDQVMAQSEQRLRQGWKTATDNFLKERYWFQLIRTAFFRGKTSEAIELFLTHAAEFPKNPIYYRSMSYMAGAFYRQKDYSHANYYFGRVYDGCDQLKTVAHYSFHPQDETDWKATLALCKSKDEQATLWQMLGIFYTDEQRAIRAIYEIDPQSPKLDLLLTRAVNISEQRFDAWEGNPRPVPSRPDSSGKALLALVTRIAAAGNTHKPWMWQMAAGYLNTLGHQYAAATASFTRAEKMVPADQNSQAQFRLLQFINKVAAAWNTPMSTKLENEWLPDLEWLKQISTREGTPFRSADAFAWMRKTLAARYRRSPALPGAGIRSECFVHSTDFYSNDRRVQALKDFLDNPNKTPFEKYCAQLSEIGSRDIPEYQAIRMALADSLDKAIAYLNGNPAAATVLPGNPFNGRIQDCHDCDHEAPQKIKYSKLSLLQKMKEMEDRIKAGQDVYTNASLLGNVFYNLSHFGNARIFYECKIIGSGQSDPWIIDSIFRAPLTDMKKANAYYSMALEAAQTDEQRAKCQYLLSKCQRNEWYNKHIYNNTAYQYGGDRKVDFTAWSGFQALKQYPNTQYYKDVIRECGYFRTYLKK